MLETSLYLGVTEPHFSHIYIYFFLTKKMDQNSSFLKLLKHFINSVLF